MGFFRASSHITLTAADWTPAKRKLRNAVAGMLRNNKCQTILRMMVIRYHYMETRPNIGLYCLQIAMNSLLTNLVLHLPTCLLIEERKDVMLQETKAENFKKSPLTHYSDKMIWWRFYPHSWKIRYETFYKIAKHPNMNSLLYHTPVHMVFDIPSEKF